MMSTNFINGMMLLSIRRTSKKKEVRQVINSTKLNSNKKLGREIMEQRVRLVIIVVRGEEKLVQRVKA